MNNPLNLSNKVSVITGGTSGIGLSIAKKFYEYGSEVAIIGRDDNKGRQAVKNIKEPYGSKREEQANKENKTEDDFQKKVAFYKCDVSLHDEIKKTCKTILKDFGKADVLVLNAGIEINESINEVRPENWQKMMDTNISGSFYFLRYLIDSMIAQKRGNVILVSTVATRTGAGAGIHYATTKSALSGIMARINYEMLSKGIRANIISPGMVDTPMLRKKYPDNNDINIQLCNQIPMGRLAIPEDIANLALFLASDMSEYICGQDIAIDGGRLLYKRPKVITKT
ncbi:MAG: SDR family NAD(P)-dependent oxidoreductase [Candidatus Humimicrobiaceae bacterium]